MTEPLATASDDLTRRLIPLAGTFNVRDVGGYRTAKGPVAWGRLLRADALHGLDEPSRSFLAGLGLRTVVDLRHEAERDRRPDALDGMVVTSHHLPIMSGDLSVVDGVPTLTEVYTWMVESSGPALASAVSLLAEPDALPALVHCSAGKDRTGVVVAFVLCMLGVDDDDIAADYCVSSDLLRQGYELSTNGWPELDEESRAKLSGLLESPRQLILDVLASIRRDHGDVESYLVAHGMDPAVPDRLRATLLS